MDILSTYIKEIGELDGVLFGLVYKGFVTHLGVDDLGQNIWALTDKGIEFCNEETKKGN